MLELNTLHCPEINEEVLLITLHDYTALMKPILERLLVNTIEFVYKSEIRRVILDCNTCFSRTPGFELHEVFALFLGGLSATRLHKIALIESSSHIVSPEFSDFISMIKTEMELQFVIERFQHTEPALAWLRVNTSQDTFTLAS